MRIYTITGLMMLGLASSAHAATLTTSIEPSITNAVVSQFNSDATSSDAEVQILTESNDSGFLEGKARAQIGNLGAFASVSGNIDLGPSNTFVRSTARFRDTLEIDIESGFLDIVVDIQGTFSDFVPFVRNDVFFTFSGLSESVSSGGLIFGINRIRAGVGPDGSDGIFFDQRGEPGLNTIRLPFSSGTIEVNSELVASSGCRTLVTINSCTASTDFFSSAVIRETRVLDSNLALIENASITSESGFDYVNGFGATAVVPLPATLPLALFGVASLLVFRKRVPLKAQIPERN